MTITLTMEERLMIRDALQRNLDQYRQREADQQLDGDAEWAAYYAHRQAVALALIERMEAGLQP